MTPTDLLAAKRRLGCTWAALGRNVGVAEETARSYGRGHRRIPDDVATRVAELLARREQADVLRAQADVLARL